MGRLLKMELEAMADQLNKKIDAKLQKKHEQEKEARKKAFKDFGIEKEVKFLNDSIKKAGLKGYQVEISTPYSYPKYSDRKDIYNRLVIAQAEETDVKKLLKTVESQLNKNYNLTGSDEVD